MFLKYTMDTQPVSSVVCICKRTWEVLKTWGDITLGHDVQGLQDIQLRGKKCTQALSMASLKDNHYILSNQKLLPVRTFITAIKKMGRGGWGTGFWFPQEKNDFQIMTLENTRGNDLFAVNVKHMVFSEGFCPHCTVIFLI